MFDINVFHYMLDNALETVLKQRVESGDFLVYISVVQEDEIDANPDEVQKNKINLLIKELKVQVTLPTAVMGGAPTRRGYKGMTIGKFKLGTLGSLESIPHKPTPSQPLGKDIADLLILRSAYEDGMDYLITGNLRDFQEGWELLKKNENANFKLLSSVDFVRQFL
jgi:hypothetical protein